MVQKVRGRLLKTIGDSRRYQQSKSPTIDNFEKTENSATAENENDYGNYTVRHDSFGSLNHSLRDLKNINNIQSGQQNLGLKPDKEMMK